tara:strand:+ start:10408 stop:11262 length:855 start_codon:yes stop_codon:yes gene_type:complete
MIIWIASYPKSGNTWVRALLSYYFFSRNEKFDFNLLKHIPNFNIGDFVDNRIKFGSDIEYADKALEVQNLICQKYKVNSFFKTHSSLNKIDKEFFTDKSVSLGCIYVVRDPRNVITSYKNFENLNYDKALKFMKDHKGFLLANKSTQQKLKIKGMELISSWSQNYNSWVNNKFHIPVCLIKYEDLIQDTLGQLKKIFEFVKKINLEKNTNFDILRAKRTILETSFENLKKLENEKGFSEKNEKIRTQNFFNQGIMNDWKINLPNNIKQDLEDNFRSEMVELGYL